MVTGELYRKEELMAPAILRSCRIRICRVGAPVVQWKESFQTNVLGESFAEKTEYREITAPLYHSPPGWNILLKIPEVKIISELLNCKHSFQKNIENNLFHTCAFICKWCTVIFNEGRHLCFQTFTPCNRCFAEAPLFPP